MKQKDQSPRYKELLKLYLSLPNQMLSMHNRDNLTEFVLHALCNEQCFNLQKAAYFVDNSDFNCLKGVAGYNRKEEFTDPLTIWSKPDQFSEHMRICNFNKKVREIESGSFKNSKSSKEELVNNLAANLGFDSPLFFKWNIKHDNQAILLFQVDQEDGFDQDLLEGLSLLGFCPSFNQ